MKLKNKDLILKIHRVEKTESQTELDNPLPLIDDVIRPAMDWGLNIGCDIGRKEGYKNGFEKGFNKGFTKGKHHGSHKVYNHFVKHGHWEESKCLDDCFWVCSCCKFPSQAIAAPKLYKYCPNCGAKMSMEE